MNPSLLLHLLKLDELLIVDDATARHECCDVREASAQLHVTVDLLPREVFKDDAHLRLAD